MRPIVFVVDDEPVIADTLSVILRNAKFDVQAFSDPARALDAAMVGIPDLLLSDVVMPGMTGIELAIAIQRISPACKILLFSGQAKTAELLAKAAESGHNFELILKPIHPKDLLARLKKVYEENSPLKD